MALELESDYRTFQEMDLELGFPFYLYREPDLMEQGPSWGGGGGGGWGTKF